MKSCLKQPAASSTSPARPHASTAICSPAISLLATLVGYSGLAVLIDESEHYSLLRGTQRERADSFFRAMIVSALGLNNGRIDAARRFPTMRAPSIRSATPRSRISSFSLP